MTPSTDAPLAESLRVLRVSAHFGKSVALVDSVTLEVAPGSGVGLVGASGAGKSLVAKSVAGFAPAGLAVTGEIECGDLRIPAGASRTRAWHRRIGYVPQNADAALHPMLRVGEQLKEALGNDASSADADGQLERLLEELGVDAPARRLRAYPHELSGGLRQRMMVAMALAVRPAWLVADEPTSALDPVSRLRVVERLQRFRREGGGLLLLTHEWDVAAALCDTLHVMVDGTIVESGPTEALLGSPRHPHTQQWRVALREAGARR